MRKIPELDKLFAEIGTYRQSSEFRELFEFVKKFPFIAPYNAMLLHIQKPGSAFVSSASEWMKRFGRSITPGARPLIILRPFGPVAFVFELGDTYGDRPFPQDLLEPFAVKGKISSDIFSRLISKLPYDGIGYQEADHGTVSAGYIEKNIKTREQVIAGFDKQTWVETHFEVVVNRNHPITTKFATMLHELGHLYCGHLGTPSEKWWSDRSGVSKNSREFEAESVCWLVCERMGIDNPSAQYLTDYLNNNGEIPEISVDGVLKAVGMIEALLTDTKQIRKEIIIRTEVTPHEQGLF